MSIQSTYGYTYPTYLLNNNQIISSNNPLPVLLGGGLSATQVLGSVNIWSGLSNNIVSSNNPLPVILVPPPAIGGTIQSLGSVGLMGCNNQLISIGNPLPVSLTAGTALTVTVPSGVTIASAVTINNPPDNAVHVHIEQQLPPGSNTVGGVYLTNTSNGNIISTANPLAVSLNTATVNVSNLPSTNLIGAVNVWNAGAPITSAAPLSVSLNTTTVNVSNLPSTNLIGAVNMYSGGSAISSGNPLTVSLNSVAITVPVSFTLPTASNVIGTVNIQTSNNTVIPVNASLIVGSNTIGGVYLVNTSNGSVISATNPLAVSVGTATVAVSNLPSTNLIGNVNVYNNSAPITNTNPLVVTPPNMQLDAFGRMRMATPFTLADYKNQYAIDTNLCFLGSNGGFSNFSKYQAAAVLSNTIQNGATSILQSYMYHNYQPGKSQLVLQSYNFNGYTCNVTKRIGYFDDNDGIYLELSGSNSGAGALSINIRSSVGYPTIATQQAIQGSWNMDNMNGGAGGPNPSGVNLNMSNVQLFFTDFQWLGVGRVRCGFVISGQMIDCHEFNCANITSNIYMTTGSLPIRAEMRNIATLSAPTTMHKLCSTVICEGGYQESGLDFSYASTISVTVPHGTSGVNYPVFCIKLAPTFNGYPNHTYLKLCGINIYSSAASIAYSVVKVNSSNLVSGGSWYAIGDGSGSMYSSNMTTYTGSIANCLTSGYVITLTNNINSPAQVPILTTKRNLIANNIQCTDSQMYVVAVTNNISTPGKTDLSTQTDTAVYVSLQWQEIY